MSTNYTAAKIYLRDTAAAAAASPADLSGAEGLYPTDARLNAAIGLSRFQTEIVAEILRDAVEGCFVCNWIVKICNRSQERLHVNVPVPARRRVVQLYYGAGYVTTVRLNHSPVGINIDANRNGNRNGNGDDDDDGNLVAWEDVPVERVGLSLCLCDSTDRSNGNLQGDVNAKAKDRYVVLDPSQQLIEMATLYGAPPRILGLFMTTDNAVWLDQDGGSPDKKNWRTVEVWEAEDMRGTARRIVPITTVAEEGAGPTVIEPESDDGSSVASESGAIPRGMKRKAKAALRKSQQS